MIAKLAGFVRRRKPWPVWSVPDYSTVIVVSLVLTACGEKPVEVSASQVGTPAHPAAASLPDTPTQERQNTDAQIGADLETLTAKHKQEWAEFDKNLTKEEKAKGVFFQTSVEPMIKKGGKCQNCHDVTKDSRDYNDSNMVQRIQTPTFMEISKRYTTADAAMLHKKQMTSGFEGAWNSNKRIEKCASKGESLESILWILNLKNETVQAVDFYSRFDKERW